MNTFRHTVTILVVCATGSLLVSCSANSAADQAAGTSEPTLTPPVASSSPESLLPEGTYRTRELAADQMMATGTSAGFDQAAVEDFVLENGVERTAVFTLKLEAGHWTEFEAFDGQAAGIGWSGTYQVVDADTVAAISDCGTITYDYALDADELTLDMVDDPCFPGEEGEQIAQTVVYETAPFAKID
jgi:hypothetical protein